MNPAVPPPPRPGGTEGGTSDHSDAAAAGPGGSCTNASYHPATEATTTNTLQISTPGAEQGGTTTSQQACVLGGIHHTPSEEDIKIYGKPVHVHGSLSKHAPIHTPVHHDPHGVVNYAKTAKEEMHEEHMHPRGVAAAEVLLPGAKTGVEMWDKVEEELPSHRRSKGHQK